MLTLRLLIGPVTALILALPHLAHSAIPEMPRMQVIPDAMFVKESSPFLFRIQGEKPDAKLALIQTDAEGNKIRYIGIMTDDGVMGDEQKRDGVFSRKFQMTEKKAGPLYFAIVEESALPPGVSEGTSKASFRADPTQLLKVQIIARPSFVELVGQSFRKLFKKSDHGSHP